MVVKVAVTPSGTAIFNNPMSLVGTKTGWVPSGRQRSTEPDRESMTETSCELCVEAAW